MDIKATTKARGFSFYRDHLSVLGASVCDSRRLAVGSQVKIELDLEAVQLLQLDYGGWNDRMTEVICAVESNCLYGLYLLLCIVIIVVIVVVVASFIYACYVVFGI